MNRAAWANAGAFAVALLLATLAAGWDRDAAPGQHLSAPAAGGGAARLEAPGADAASVRDASGFLVRPGGYQRIASCAHPSDLLLLELCEPQRVVAFSRYTTGAEAFRLGTTPRLSGLDDIEAVLAVHPDLVLLSASAGDAGRIARLRASGIAVFDLGEQAGLSTLTAQALALGALLEVRPRAEHFAATLSRRMAAVQARLPRQTPRRRAVVVLVVGTLLYGGTVGSSYHDVLEAAGLNDAAAAAYHGWPQYRLEELIALDPDVIVTARGMGATLARLPGLSAMRALSQPQGVIEMDDERLSDAGPGMLEAAEELCARAYPAAASQRR